MVGARSQDLSARNCLFPLKDLVQKSIRISSRAFSSPIKSIATYDDIKDDKPYQRSRFPWLTSEIGLRYFFAGLPNVIKTPAFTEDYENFIREAGEIHVYILYDAKGNRFSEDSDYQGFWWDENLKRPVIGFDLKGLQMRLENLNDPRKVERYENAIGTLRHELTHFAFWKKMRDQMRDQGIKNPEKEAWRKVLSPQFDLISEKRALASEHHDLTVLHRALFPASKEKSRNDFLESGFLLSTATYPYSQAIRSAVVEILDPEGIDQRGMEDFVSESLDKSLLKVLKIRRRVVLSAQKRYENILQKAATGQISEIEKNRRLQIIESKYLSMTGDLLDLIFKGSGGIGARTRLRQEQIEWIKDFYQKIEIKIKEAQPELFSEPPLFEEIKKSAEFKALLVESMEGSGLGNAKADSLRPVFDD